MKEKSKASATGRTTACTWTNFEMPAAKKRTRDELIAGGYCPVCSKCTASVVGGLLYCGSLYACRKCDTLLLGLVHNNEEEFFEVTGYWKEIRDWYDARREEIDSQLSQLEMQLLTDVPGAIAAIIGGAKGAAPSKGLTLVKR
jgi:hypothetical protein